MSKATPIGRININVTRIDKAHLVPGKNGKYLGLTFWENDQPDQYGNAGFVTQEISKEARDRGEKGPIVGNWKRIETRQQPRPSAPKPTPAQPAGEEDSPF